MFSITARNYLHELTPADWKEALAYAAKKSRSYPHYRGKMEAEDLVHEVCKRFLENVRTWDHRKERPIQNVFDVIDSIANHDYEKNNPEARPQPHSGQEDNELIVFTACSRHKNSCKRRVPRFVDYPDGWENKPDDPSKRDPTNIAIVADDLRSKLQKKLDSKDHRCPTVLALLVDNEGLTLDELVEKSGFTKPVVRRLVNIIRDEMKALHDEN